MQDPWSLVIALLLAVLIGALLPVLFQVFLTLGSVRRTLLRVGPKLDETLAEVRDITRRANQATTGFEPSVQRARKVLDATGDLGETLQALNRGLKPAAALGNAVGPAVAAWIQSWIERHYCRPDETAEEANPDTRDQPSSSQGDAG